MNIEEILKRCGGLDFKPGAKDMAVIREGVANRQQLFLVAWPETWMPHFTTTRRDYLLLACSGVDDPLFVAAVDDHHSFWLDQWRFLHAELPPPVDVYHLTAVGGVVSSQIIKRAMPSVESKVGVSLKIPTASSRGLGGAVLRGRNDIR